MTVVNIYDAKTQLSKLIEEAAAGNDVVIARGGKPVARADAVYVCAASIREIAIKSRLGKIETDAALPVDAIDSSGFQGLAMSAHHAAAVAKLPMHHGDPQ